MRKQIKNFYKIKSVDELTFADDFMFGRVMRDKTICKELLERLLKIKIDKLTFPKLQEVLNPCYDTKSIRLDVFAADSKRNFDIEIQIAQKEDLPLRMRYYQSLMDTDTLLKGSDYIDLKQSYVIFICLSDPIGAGLPVYTVRQKIDENGETFDDKSVKVLYNATAYTDEKDKNIRAFLEYVKTKKPSDEWTERLEKRVAEIREKQKFRGNYMTYQMHIKEWKREGITIGKAEGIAYGEHKARIETARGMLNKKYEQTEIAELTGLSLAEVQHLAQEI